MDRGDIAISVYGHPLSQVPCSFQTRRWAVAAGAERRG